jgi:hypothetical protein
MAKTPTSEIVATIEIVRTMKKTLDGLTETVEQLGERIRMLEQQARAPGK